MAKVVMGIRVHGDCVPIFLYSLEQVSVNLGMGPKQIFTQNEKRCPHVILRQYVQYSWGGPGDWSIIKSKMQHAVLKEAQNYFVVILTGFIRAQNAPFAIVSTEVLSFFREAERRGMDT